jgi:hypothetical protein
MKDLRRVQKLYVEAMEHSADRALVGFRVRGPVVRIVWAVIEVIPLGSLADKDLAPDLPPSEQGYEGWDLRLDGITFSQGPTAELTDLDEAKPNGLEDAPAVLVPYPECRGRSSGSSSPRLRPAFCGAYPDTPRSFSAREILTDNHEKRHF